MGKKEGRGAKASPDRPFRKDALHDNTAGDTRPPQKPPGYEDPPEPRGYEDLKAVAAERNVTLESTYSLADSNDPWMAGQPARQRDAKWFAEHFHGNNFGQGVHVRRVHYFLQSTALTRPDGGGKKPYINDEPCWTWIKGAAADARLLGLVDGELFDDRRNPAPIINVTAHDPGSIRTYIADEEPPDWQTVMPDHPALTMVVDRPPMPSQRYVIVLMCEKTTVNDILEPIARRCGCNLITGSGDLSITACLALVERAIRDGRPVVIFYISDFDPSGDNMPVGVAVKIQFEIMRRRERGETVPPITLIPILLTLDQVKKYDLPRNPTKKNDPKAAAFVERYGAGATELDAMVALRPGVMETIITEWVERYYDATLAERTMDAFHEHQAALREEIDAINESVAEDHTEEIQRLEEEWDAIAEAMTAWMNQAQPVWSRMTEALQDSQPEDSDFELPEAEEGDEHPEPLFDSRRGYWDQLRVFKARQGRTALQPKGRRGRKVRDV